MKNDPIRCFRYAAHNRVINALAITSLLLVVSGCNTSSIGHSVITETNKTPSAQTILTPPKDDSKKDIDVNSINNQAKSLKYSKLAFFETQRPKDGEAVGGYTAAISGNLRVEENCVVVVLENGSAVQPIFASYTVVWNNTQNILTYNSKQYRDGDYIRLGGGVIPTTIADTLTKRTIPNCPDSILFLVTG